jgi:hypothetical protein
MQKNYSINLLDSKSMIAEDLLKVTFASEILMPISLPIDLFYGWVWCEWDLSIHR